MTAYVGYYGGSGYYNIPTTHALRGKYDFQKQKIKQALSGAIFTSGIQRVVWVFPAMTTADFDWWVDRYEAGGPVAFRLWEDDTRRVSLDFTSGQLLRPTYDGISKNMYLGVTITITNLSPVIV